MIWEDCSNPVQGVRDPYSLHDMGQHLQLKSVIPLGEYLGTPKGVYLGPYGLKDIIES